MPKITEPVGVVPEFKPRSPDTPSYSRASKSGIWEVGERLVWGMR